MNHTEELIKLTNLLIDKNQKIDEVVGLILKGHSEKQISGEMTLELINALHEVKVMKK